VNSDKNPRIMFHLRLAASLRKEAKRLADPDGISLDNFISLAVTVKVNDPLAADSTLASMVAGLEDSRKLTEEELDSLFALALREILQDPVRRPENFPNPQAGQRFASNDSA
jgi:hypothetical protein